MIIKNFQNNVKTEDKIYTTSYIEHGKRKQVYFTSLVEAAEKGDSSCYELIWDNNEQCYVIGNIVQ